jgi:hypothetical protein
MHTKSHAAPSVAHANRSPALSGAPQVRMAAVIRIANCGMRTWFALQQMGRLRRFSAAGERILYIVKRTQLCFEDGLWAALRIRSRQSGVSISELARQAIRDRYLSGAARRREAMRAAVGIWKDRSDLPHTQGYVRRLRKGSRIKRVAS